MKVSSEWKKLTQAQRRAWNAWAKNNPVLLDDGNVRRVSGRKAMTMVLRNRASAGDAASPTVVPAAFTWQPGALSLRDAGPFTENLGYVGFRVEQNLASATKWFVWATPPVTAGEPAPQGRLRFVKCMALGASAVNDLVPDIGPDYAPVCGTWDGPGVEGAWPVDTFIWFRVHQYAHGQLGPGVVMQGRIQVEL
jgi:hypothetical protein